MYNFTDEEKAILSRFIDAKGVIKIWPSKRVKQEIILKYLAGFFEKEKTYSEHDVNLLISGLHDFNDLFILRRGLVDDKWLMREKDGSFYWLNPLRY
ncbi:MAG: hypothetical protein BGO41_05235 [Clostridiales bacterium 38-18]|nr:MAG: hypothetical protein BGO41_05235 [Clostridiales bacterium 38-18]